MLSIIGSIIAVIVFGLVGFKVVPIVLDRLKTIDTLSAINRVMIFFSGIAAMVLFWVGLPAFAGAVKFLLQGHSFARFGFVGTTIFYVLVASLWIVINCAELYPMAVKSNRTALQSMLSQRKAMPKDGDRDEDAEARQLKDSLKKSGRFSLKDCNLICSVGFVADAAIAWCNTPLLTPGSSWDKVISLGDVSQISFSQVCVLAMLIGGMTLNAMLFEKFANSSMLLDKRASSGSAPMGAPISPPSRPVH
jgi:hypothetical protein